MKLHGQAVFDAHAGHLGEHLRLEDLLLLGDRASGEDASVERLGGCGVEIGGHRGEVAVVGGGCAHRLEEGAAVSERVQIALVGADVLAGDLAELLDVVDESGVLGVDDGVGTERGQDPALPARGLDRLVILQRVERRVGGREDLDAELLEESAGAELRRLQLLRDEVVVGIGVVRAQALGQAKLLLKGVVDPEPGGRSAEEVVVLRKDAPDLARVGRAAAVGLAECPATPARCPASRASGRCSGRAG